MYMEKLKIPKNRNFRERLLGSLSSNELYLARRQNDDSTEIMNMIGMTDVTMPEPTAEIMLTTLGQPPDVMYDLDESPIKSLSTHANIANAIAVTDMTQLSQFDITTHKSLTSTISLAGYTDHSTIFIILAILTIVLLIFLCGIACLIAKTRQRCASSRSSECDPDCQSAKEPLIGTCKLSPMTSKSCCLGERR